MDSDSESINTISIFNHIQLDQELTPSTRAYIHSLETQNAHLIEVIDTMKDSMERMNSQIQELKDENAQKELQLSQLQQSKQESEQISNMFQLCLQMMAFRLTQSTFECWNLQNSLNEATNELKKANDVLNEYKQINLELSLRIYRLENILSQKSAIIIAKDESFSDSIVKKVKLNLSDDLINSEIDYQTTPSDYQQFQSELQK